MDLEPQRSGQIEYIEQGFTLHWDESALRVEVTDYHARILRLPWKDVLALAVVAGAQRRPERRDQ